MFPDMLVYLRKREGYTQTELAKRLGISRSTVGMYESGKREPDFEMLEAIADLFNVSMSVLIDDPKKAKGAPAYTEDAELSGMLEDLRSRDDMRMLFKLAKGATPEDVRQAVAIIEALRKQKL